MSTTPQSMHIHPYERAWLYLTIALLIGFSTVIGVASFAMGFQVPSPEREVDPKTVAKEGPFANPGLHMLSEGKYEAYILAQAVPVWRFVYGDKPLEVPIGSTVTFYVTSTDVQHGFNLLNTNVNFQVVPGQVSKLAYKFEKAGEYTFICTEYCGLGHAAMFGKITVTP